MVILSHRGAWNTAEEKNTVKAFEHSFSNGFGTETDLRDRNGEIVISHDMADESCITAAEFFELFNSFDPSLPLALNIKADGLQQQAEVLLAKYKISNYFFFDMSVPDTLGYRRMGLKYLSRLSEYEKEPALYEDAAGIWLDCFEGIWYDAGLINSHLERGKIVALVSPDLHRREYRDFWKFLKESTFVNENNLLLCTDFPFEARDFFEG